MSVAIGEIRLCAFKFAPDGWLACQGQQLTAAGYPELYKAIGTTFGSDGDGTFLLPDLRERAPIHAGQGPDGTDYNLGEAGGKAVVALAGSQIPAHGHGLPASTATGDNASPEGCAYATSEAQQYTPLEPDTGGNWLKAWGGNQPHENRMPYLTLTYIIAATSDAWNAAAAVAVDSTVKAGVPGQIGYFASSTVPDGWVPCNGEDGRAPDLRGRFMLGAGADYPSGQPGGEATHTLLLQELPGHYHSVAACGAEADAGSPVGNFPARYSGPRGPLYATHVDTSLPVSGLAGAGQAHNNMPPYLPLNLCCDPDGTVQGDAFLGEIRCCLAAPQSKHWLLCDGSAVPIRSAPALYSLLAGYYGHIGAEFLLPNLVGNVAVGLVAGNDPGSHGGVARVILSSDELPTHAHAAQVSTASDQRQTAPAPDTFPTEVVGRGGALQLYATPEEQAGNEVLMLPSLPAGGGAAHNNMAPYMALNFYLCVNGVFPPHSPQ